MKLMLHSLIRAIMYCFFPRIIMLTLLPLVLLLIGVWWISWLFWEPVTQWALEAVQGNQAAGVFIDWLEGWGLLRLKAVLGAAVVLFVFLPLMVMGCVQLVSLLVMPFAVNLVERRRFPGLVRREGGRGWRGWLWSLGSLGVAVLVAVVSMPLWLIPPLALLIIPMIWGWLTYRIMAFDALSAHASLHERRQILRLHKFPLLAMGTLCGYLGVAPSLWWLTGAMWIAMAPVIVPLALWIYTVLYVFCSLWFAHYSLAALEELRNMPASSGPQAVGQNGELIVTLDPDSGRLPGRDNT